MTSPRCSALSLRSLVLLPVFSLCRLLQLSRSFRVLLSMAWFAMHRGRDRQGKRAAAQCRHWNRGTG